jgi:cephalosporin hydroxylase
LKNAFAPEGERVSFSSESICERQFRVTYRGIEALRCPFDYVIYQMILSRLQPDLVIEIGTGDGGGAFYLADLMSIMDHGILHTIDIEHIAVEPLLRHPRIKLFKEGWEKYSLDEAKGFSRIIVIDDGSHIYEDTLGAMHKFAPLVSVGSYLIVEDGIVNRLGIEKIYNGGPLKAIREFLKSNKNFEVDRYWCDFFGRNATFNVNGYLKRTY